MQITASGSSGSAAPEEKYSNTVWYDVKKAPFSLHGFFEPESENYFHRIPEAVASAVSDHVSVLQKQSTGGRVRFSTDSPYISIRAHFLDVSRASHMTLVSYAGFDLYKDGLFGQEYVREFRMPYDMIDSYCQSIDVSPLGMQYFTLNFPMHSVVDRLEIGISPDASIGPGKPYRDILPIVFYGSSIVHGIACSRPGMMYENIVSRILDMDYINLGFSGHALAEEEICRWMSALPMSVFVADYDHNAPSPEYLTATHHRMYEIIREKNPSVPYIMITRPNFWTNGNPDYVLRMRDVILNSYLEARRSGDKRVFLIDGMSFFADSHMYDCTMDHVHPNDVGFMRMGEVIAANIRYILSHIGQL